MINLDELMLENERLSKEPGMGNDVLQNFVKMPDGDGHVVVRILPPAKSGMFGRAKSSFFQGTRIHRVNNRNFHCPKALQGGKWIGECPICRYYTWLWQESEKKGKDEAEAMQNKARAIKPIERYYYNVIVRQELNEKTGKMESNVGPKILSVGKTVHGMIIKAIVGNEDLAEKPLGDVTNSVSGRDFKMIKQLRKSGANSYPVYDGSKFIDPSPLGNPEEVAKWAETLHDLGGLRVIKPVEELKENLKIHLGLTVANKQDDFDPSEYQKKEEKSTVTANVAVAPTVVKEAVASPAADQSLVDDDFLNQLRNM